MVASLPTLWGPRRSRRSLTRARLLPLRLRLAPLLSLSGWAVGALASGSFHSGVDCPWTPLQVVGNDEYVHVDSNTKTTCTDHSDGSCPFAVPFPNFPCLVNCVPSEAACAAANSHAPAVDPFVNPHVCRGCGITACADCSFMEKGKAVCRRCFDGFIGIGGSNGDFESCVLWDHNFVLSFFVGVFGLVGGLFMVVMLATCFTAYRMTCGAILMDVGERMAGSQAMSASLSGPNSPGRTPLLSQNVTETNKTNKQSIRQGLMLSLMSSIKASNMRKAVMNNPSVSFCGRFCSMLKGLFDDKMTDLGLGLQLFFKTQIFLIVVAASVFSAARSLEDKKLFAALDMLDLCAEGRLSHTNITHSYNSSTEQYYTHAKKMQVMCSVLWAWLVLLAWCFHVFQNHFIDRYDKKTHSAEDYTLRLEDVPPEITSEKHLKSLLERKFRMKGRLYGVSICYNVTALKDPEKIEEMIDRVIESDDLALGWAKASLATPKEELERLLDEDKKELEEMLMSGQLKGCGVAYAVFKYQNDMARIMSEHRGISIDTFTKSYGKALSPGRGLSQEEPEQDSNDAAVDVVKIRKDTSEPAGLRWFLMWTPQAVRLRRKFIELPLRMVVYIGIYAVVAQLFFWFMIKPWQDNDIEGAESASSVKVISKLVLLFNFGIQTLVMVDVERTGFIRLAVVDQVTFVWNTVLLLVTNAYLFLQDCFREGIRWDLTPPDQEVEGIEAWWQWQRTSLQSVRIEKAVGENLSNTMTDQIMMLYVAGEVANVLLPVMFNYLAIRFIFLSHRGETPDTMLGKIKKKLRVLLVRSQERPNITVREAERAQILVPLLLWMEYTYMVIFPGMAFITFYLLTDENSVVSGWLLGFSIIFFIWQRYVMLWLYGKSTYDSQDSYDAFIFMFGFVLSMLPPASVWWAWRLGEIIEYPFAVLTMLLVYFLSLLSYEFGLIMIEWYKGARDDGVDEFGDGGDPGYERVVEEHGMSWWNLNPVYVLKNRHCPYLKGHEVQDDEENYWPKAHTLQGFFELGKEFKHLPNEESLPEEIPVRRRYPRPPSSSGSSPSSIAVRSGYAAPRVVQVGVRPGYMTISKLAPGAAATAAAAGPRSVRQVVAPQQTQVRQQQQPMLQQQQMQLPRQAVPQRVAPQTVMMAGGQLVQPPAQVLAHGVTGTPTIQIQRPGPSYTAMAPAPRPATMVAAEPGPAGFAAGRQPFMPTLAVGGSSFGTTVTSPMLTPTRPAAPIAFTPNSGGVLSHRSMSRTDGSPGQYMQQAPAQLGASYAVPPLVQLQGGVPQVRPL